jgi:hypothetical protein
VAPTLFERLGRLPPTTKRAQEVSPAQRLLDFLQRWPKDTISARNIRQFGPRAVRAQRSEIDSAEVLVRHGWLAPAESHRRDRRVWRINRRPTIHPIVEP